MKLHIMNYIVSENRVNSVMGVIHSWRPGFVMATMQGDGVATDHSSARWRQVKNYNKTIGQTMIGLSKFKIF